MRSYVLTYVRSFVFHSCSHSHSFIRSLVHLFSQSVTRSFIRLLIKLINRSLLFSQLFKRPHPPKRVFRSVESDSQTGALVNVDRLFFHNLPNLVPSAQPVKGKSPRVQISFKNFPVLRDVNAFMIEKDIRVLSCVAFPTPYRCTCRSNWWADSEKLWLLSPQRHAREKATLFSL